MRSPEFKILHQSWSMFNRSIRLWAPTFWKRLYMWVRTVASEIPRLLAISLFDCPCAIRVAISRSRGVKEKRVHVDSCMGPKADVLVGSFPNERSEEISTTTLIPR